MQSATHIEQNKFLAIQFLQLVSEDDLEQICKIISSDWQMNIGLGKAEIPCGPEGMKKLFETFGKIKQQWFINDVIAEGDKVVVRATNKCWQENFLGIPSYGQPQSFTATFIHKIIEGKIAETWRNADDLGRVLQLGAKIQPADEPATTTKNISTSRWSGRKYVFDAFSWKRSY
jgi:hypothetical protein